MLYLRHQLATTLEAAGDRAGAIELMREVVAARVLEQGAAHFETKRAKEDLGRLEAQEAAASAAGDA